MAAAPMAPPPPPPRTGGGGGGQRSEELRVNDDGDDKDEQQRILGRAVADVLFRMMAPENRATADDVVRTPFDGRLRKIPSIPLDKYAHRVIHYAPAWLSHMAVALCYVDRVLTRNRGFRLTNRNVHRLMLACTVLAMKFLEDVFYTNDYYGKVGGIGVLEMNSLEIALLAMIDFDLYVEQSAYRVYESDLAETRARSEARIAMAETAGVMYHGVGNLWIGDLRTAAAVARDRTAPGTFAAVFNASGCESRHVSYETDYAARGILYDTLMDVVNGMTLGECDELTSAMDVAREMARNGDFVTPPLGIVHCTQTCTDVAIQFFLREAARKIRALVERVGPWRPILVHCSAGHNRSAASVVAYAVLALHEDPDAAIARVRESAREANLGRVALTNDRFVWALRHMRPGPMEPYASAYYREMMSIVEYARRLALAAQRSRGVREDVKV